MSPLDKISQYHPELTELRRDLHAHPELGMGEHRTAEIVAQQLESFGVEVHRGVGKTGVVGVLRGRPGQPRDRPARRHGRAADRGGERRPLSAARPAA
jgi:metal-dependent amidase/aminoacylase/carboxypeptidase family protein